MGIFSAGNIIKIGATALIGIAAVSLIKSYGGPAGIGNKLGSSIGGGFSSFTKSISDAFTTSIFGGTVSNDSPEASPNTSAPNELTGKAPALGTETLQDNFGKTSQGLTDFNRFLGNVLSGAQFNRSALNTPRFFTPQAIETRKSTITANQQFYSSPFGGYGSAEAQESALQQAIMTNKELYPQWFK